MVVVAIVFLVFHPSPFFSFFFIITITARRRDAVNMEYRRPMEGRREREKESTTVKSMVESERK